MAAKNILMKPLLANLGFIFQIAGLLSIAPIVAAYYYNEQAALISFFLTSLSFFSVGFMLNALSERKELDYKASCVLIILTFLLVSLIGAIPYFYLKIFDTQNKLDDFINSYFESISGYTTTGLTFLEPQALPKSLILYRSLSQWIGGIGIVYLLLAFFYSETVANSIAEAVGIKKTLSKVKSSIIEVLFVYSFYTLVFFLILYFLGLKDAVASISLVFSALATGGFMPGVELTQNAIIILLAAMIVGATSFEIHHSLFFRKWYKLKSSEFILFLALIIVASLFMFYFYYRDITLSLFHVTSSITTTGFSFISFSAIPENLKVFFITLMFIGGCSFSTSGGIKVYRIIVLFKSIGHAIRKKLGIQSENVNETEIFISLITILLSALLVFVSAFIFTFYGNDFVDSLFECISAYSTVGLSLNLNLNALLKLILISLMLIGRVEIFTILIAISKEKAVSVVKKVE
jgi:trk system potassium uptake protein TrkH